MATVARPCRSSGITKEGIPTCGDRLASANGYLNLIRCDVLQPGRRAARGRAGGRVSEGSTFAKAFRPWEDWMSISATGEPLQPRSRIGRILTFQARLAYCWLPLGSRCMMWCAALLCQWLIQIRLRQRRIVTTDHPPCPQRSKRTASTSSKSPLATTNRRSRRPSHLTGCFQGRSSLCAWLVTILFG
jgi:hypothetical protein